MRAKRSFNNIITSFIFQLVNVLVNFIIPNMIIKTYGSETNGLINSITQFLSYITLAEAGLGGVINKTLYKNLIEKDNVNLSKTIKSASSFFRKIGYFFIAYVIILTIIYPQIISEGFDTIYTVSLIVIISLGSFMQYFVGITAQLLINADQKMYIVNISKIIASIISTILMIFLIKREAPIQIVKLASALVFICCPLFYYSYVKAKYKLNSKISKDKGIIDQRWDGFSQHIAFFIHRNTDITILSLFNNMLEVSVYSVYMTVTSGVKAFLGIITSGVTASFGNIIAENDKEKLRKYYMPFDYIYFLITVIIFTITRILIIDFVKIYTHNVVDINYIRPLFATILIGAECMYAIRCSYTMIIYATGDFKQTKSGAWIEAGINIILSLLLVKQCGMIGLAIGTFCAMAYRAIDSLVYLCKNILKIDFKKFLLKYIVNIFSTIVVVLIMFLLPLNSPETYMQWINKAILVSIVTISCTIIINYIFFKKELIEAYSLYISRIVKNVIKRK